MGIKYYLSKAFKKIHLPALINTTKDNTSKICSGAHIASSTIGRYSYVGNFSTVINCSVGNFCSIADRCTIGGMSHPIEWVSTSPVMYAGKNCLRKNFSDNYFNETKRTVIENDVWIGENCLIKSGVRVSNGSIIGMGSVLTKDTGPYEIWAGNPAKKTRSRFDEETIKILLDSKWWNWDDKKLAEKGPCFNDISRFVSEEKEKKYE